MQVYRLVIVNVKDVEDTRDFTLLSDAYKEYNIAAARVPRIFKRVTLWDVDDAHGDLKIAGTPAIT